MEECTGKQLFVLLFIGLYSFAGSKKIECIECIEYSGSVTDTNIEDLPGDPCRDGITTTCDGKCASGDVIVSGRGMVNVSLYVATCMNNKGIPNGCHDGGEQDFKKLFVILEAYKFSVETGYALVCDKTLCNSKKETKYECRPIDPSARRCHECVSTVHSQCPGGSNITCDGPCVFGEVVVATPEADFTEKKISISHCLSSKSHNPVPVGCYKNPLYIGSYLGLDPQISVSSGYAYVCDRHLCNDGPTEQTRADCDKVVIKEDYGGVHYVGRSEASAFTLVTAIFYCVVGMCAYGVLYSQW